uniref:AlNc14C166G7898 protein n=1 Tax=Albugo laibachii Nc14 TaxID=890382 RepID=F0WN65_9STRA|nr:AlNc14C166G7898 [Albugo laibachii Nc14]|eukprot:CCA22754.1 AlNc14C166G7898 [Albugo laibachii Nc14]
MRVISMENGGDDQKEQVKLSKESRDIQPSVIFILDEIPEINISFLSGILHDYPCK